MSLALGKKQKTSRGFEYIEFLDFNGEPCSIQISSVATENMLWLGCEHETKHHVTGEPCGARMHLDRKLARQIMTKLSRWLSTGHL